MLRHGMACGALYTSLLETPYLNIPWQPGIEEICLTAQCRKLPAIIIGSIYRHSKANVLLYDYIQEAITSTLMRKKTMFILGDFNDDLCGGKKFTNVIKINS